MNVTKESYYKEVLNSDTPWIISFIKRKKCQAHLVHSEEIYGSLKILADEYQGKIRFGIIDSVAEEHLKLTFEIFTVPQTFYFLNGMAYEMPALSIFYDNIHHFIDGNYLVEDKVYTSFPIPTYICGTWTQYYFYAYRYGLVKLHESQYDIWDYLKENTSLTEYKQVEAFFNQDVKVQYKQLLSLAAFVLLVAFIFVM